MKSIGRRTNSLEFKIGVSFFLIGIIPTILYLCFNNLVISKRIEDMENSKITFDINQVNQIINKEKEIIEIEVRDNSIWDETYNKIKEKDTQWFKYTIIDWLTKESNINLIAIINEDKEIFAKYGLKNDGAEELLSKKIIDKLIKEDNFQSTKIISGFKEYNGDLYLLAASPILKNDYTGPAREMIILAKKVDAEGLKLIKEKFHYNIFLTYEKKIISNIELDRATEKLFLERENKILEFENSKMLIKRIPILDISNKKIGYIGIIQMKDPLIITSDFIYKNSLWILLVIYIFLILVGKKLKNVIINPIKNLEGQINEMIKHGHLNYIEIDGANEIKSLGRHFNKMVDSIYHHKEENEELKISTSKDDLTQLYNHKHFYEYLKCKTEEKQKMSMLFCDIDKFKAINDTYGHKTGDYVLREVGNFLKEMIKNKGKVFRYGGEELIIILENHTSEEAFNVAENIRKGISKNNKIQQERFTSPITISIGISSYPDDATTMDSFIEKADKAMYFAKGSGRNKTCMYDENMENS